MATAPNSTVMGGAKYWTDYPAEIAERDGVFFLTLTTGAEPITFVMTQRDMSLLGHRATKAVAERASRTADVLPIRKPKREG